MQSHQWIGVVLSGSLLVWACGSDDPSGGSSATGGAGGAGATGGNGAAAGTSGGGAGATGGSGGAAGSTTGGSAGTGGGVTDAGVDALPDVYVYPPCVTACEKARTPCVQTEQQVQDCVQACSGASLGSCEVELKAYVDCVNGSDIQCVGGQGVGVGCEALGQAFQTCENG